MDSGVGWLVPIEASATRFVDSVATLTDGGVRQHSLVPPWTRGHVIAHVCRAGDSLIRLLNWARTGVETAQYASMEARAAEIEAGATQSAHELLADVMESADRFTEAVRTLPQASWSHQVRPRTGEWRTPETLVPMRLRELEIHHVDLGVGYTVHDIPADSARWILDDVVDAFARRAAGVPAMEFHATDTDFARRIGDPQAPALVVGGLQADLLGWLTGRVPPAQSPLQTRSGTALPAAPEWI